MAFQDTIQKFLLQWVENQNANPENRKTLDFHVKTMSETLGDAVDNERADAVRNRPSIPTTDSIKNGYVVGIVSEQIAFVEKQLKSIEKKIRNKKGSEKLRAEKKVKETGLAQLKLLIENHDFLQVVVDDVKEAIDKANQSDVEVNCSLPQVLEVLKLLSHGRLFAARKCRRKFMTTFGGSFNDLTQKDLECISAFALQVNSRKPTDPMDVVGKWLLRSDEFIPVCPIIISYRALRTKLDEIVSSGCLTPAVVESLEGPDKSSDKELSNFWYVIEDKITDGFYQGTSPLASIHAKPIEVSIIRFDNVNLNDFEGFDRWKTLQNERLARVYHTDHGDGNTDEGETRVITERFEGTLPMWVAKKLGEWEDKSCTWWDFIQRGFKLIVRDVLRGLWFLYDKGDYHGSLEDKGILITQHNRAKLLLSTSTDTSTEKKLEDGIENDINCWKNTIEHAIKPRDDFQFPQDLDFRMFDSKLWETRAEMKFRLDSPFFWTRQQKLDFIMKFDRYTDTNTLHSKAIHFAMPSRGWGVYIKDETVIKRLFDKFKADRDDPDSVPNDSYLDLLIMRFCRNIVVHYNQHARTMGVKILEELEIVEEIEKLWPNLFQVVREGLRRWSSGLEPDARDDVLEKMLSSTT